jgi:enterochelin esterase family protein
MVSLRSDLEMKIHCPASLAITILFTTLCATGESYKEPDYPVPPEAVQSPSVAEGTIERFEFSSTEIFKGTMRRYWVYVPKQYKSSQPAALMVFQDGHTYVDRKGQFRAPTVMDHLIAKGEMPVTIGVFVNPGAFTETLPETDGWDSLKGLKSNRSVEYDTLSADYVTFLEKELLPEVAKKWNITTDPGQRAIVGISSGGICAFTAAWERPDLFRKVLSHVGSFTDIRGGYAYPAIIRKTKPVKPLRVFLQDGAMDLNNQFGNWPLANQQMANSLDFMGYDHKFVFDPRGAHSGKFGGSILPDSLRWLWRK